MPLYEYRCTACGVNMELLQRVGDPPPQACLSCGGKVVKVISAPALQFKGSGFYLTDYVKKSEPPAGEKQAETTTSKDDSGKKTEKTSDSASTSESKDAKPAKPKE